MPRICPLSDFLRISFPLSYPPFLKLCTPFLLPFWKFLLLTHLTLPDKLLKLLSELFPLS